MAAPVRNAGALQHRVAFDKRGASSDDGYGNTVTNWQEQCVVSAAFTHLRGGESVLASRLQGQHVQVVTVRASSETRQIETDWRMRDVRTGASFNVRDITPTEDRAWLEILVQSGGADG